MPAALSGSEHIRRQLEQNFDLPAAEVQERLLKKGIDIEVGLVYQVRSKMKQERKEAEKQKQLEAEQRKANVAKGQKTKANNPKPLRQHILDVLSGSDTGMTLKELTEQVRKTYNVAWGELETFKQNVRKKLRLLVLSGDVTQQGAEFLLKELQPAETVSVDAVLQEFTDSPTNVPEGGIAVLVMTLKQVVTKIGKQDAKEIIDAL